MCVCGGGGYVLDIITRAASVVAEPRLSDGLKLDVEMSCLSIAVLKKDGLEEERRPF